MAVGLKGGTTLAGTEDKTFWVRAMLARATPHLWYNRFANQEGIPTRNGTNLEWRRLSRITATTTALTEGTSGAETTPTVVTVAATVFAVAFGQPYLEPVRLTYWPCINPL